MELAVYPAHGALVRVQRPVSMRLPVVARLRLAGDLDRAMLEVRAWFNVVGGLSLGSGEEMPPLTRDELDVAWTYFDWSCEGTLTLPKLRRTLRSSSARASPSARRHQARR